MKKFYLLCALVAVSLTAMAQSRVDSIITQFFDEWVENDSLMSYEMRDLDTVYVYDANNNLISKQTYQFTSLETAPMGWNLIQSDDYVYDANNHCVEYTRHEWKPVSFLGPYEWKNTLKHEYTYEGEILKTDAQYDYESYTGNLYANSKDVYNYDTTGLLERIDTYGYNESISSWRTTPTYRVSYTYNEHNRVIEELKQEFVSSAWKNKTKRTCTYNTNLQLECVINYNWNNAGVGSYFVPYTKIQYTYDTFGNLILKSVSEYGSYGEWTDTYAHTYTYNALNQLTTYILSYGVASSMRWKYTYEYDSDGDLYCKSHFNWDSSYNDWVGYRRYYYYYQGKPSPTYELLIYLDAIGNGFTYEELEQCVVTGDGRHPYNSTVQCYATCPEGCRFVRWVDGNTDNPRTFTMTTNIVTKAYFEKVEKVNIYVYADPLEGYAEGAGEYLVGDNITITAIPNEGYAFLQWNDGNTDNPRQVTVTETWTYIAQFTAQADALEDVLMQQNHNGKYIIDGELYIIKDGKFFSPLGTEIKATQH